MYELKKENTKVEVSISISPEEWEEGIEKVYQSSKGKFNVVGFRKGHAPRKVIEKTYGDNVFFEDTVEHFVREALGDVLRKEPELEPVCQPETHFQSYTANDGLKMTVTYEIVPDFELCKYTGVTIDVHGETGDVTEDQIQLEIKHHLLEDNVRYENVDREIKNGDSVLIDFMGFIDNVEFDGGSANDYPLEIGSHSFIDTFEDQLIGHKKGEVVDVNVTFPENYGATEFAGKKALFKVTIKEVREKVLPTLDDKFVSDTTEFETVEEYRNHIIAHIQDKRQKTLEAEFEYCMREYLLENTKVEIPEVMIDMYAEESLESMRQTLEMYHIALEDYLASTGSTIDDYIKQNKERTLRGIKSRYIYRKIIEEAGLTVSDEELAPEIVNATTEEDKIKAENKIAYEKLQKFLRDNNSMNIIND